MFRWLEQVAADVPAIDDWLSPNEAARLSALRFPKRRADWRLGRWTAKLAVAPFFEQPLALADIEIRAAASGAPEVFYADRPLPVAISISHRAGVACCAVAQPAVALGCDLELIEPRSDAFVADYFTDMERALIAQAAPPRRPELITLLWSAKESALKALHVGLRADTRSITVKLTGAAGLSTAHAGGEFRGWWQSDGTLVRTLVAARDAPSLRWSIGSCLRPGIRRARSDCVMPGLSQLLPPPKVDRLARDRSGWHFRALRRGSQMLIGVVRQR